MNRQQIKDLINLFLDEISFYRIVSCKNNLSKLSKNYLPGGNPIN